MITPKKSRSHLVKDGEIGSLEEIYLRSLAVNEYKSLICSASARWIRSLKSCKYNSKHALVIESCSRDLRSSMMVMVRIVPAPRGTEIVAAMVLKKALQFARIDVVFTGSRGSTSTLGNFFKGCQLS